MNNNTVICRDKTCPACGGKGCDICHEMGFIGEVIIEPSSRRQPDGISKALEKERLRCSLGFQDLGVILGVSTARASQLCRNAGEARTEKEIRAINLFLGADSRPATYLFCDLAEIGDGDVTAGISFLSALARQLRHARCKYAWPFIKLKVMNMKKKEALHSIATLVRFFLDEHIKKSEE